MEGYVEKKGDSWADGAAGWRRGKVNGVRGEGDKRRRVSAAPRRVVAQGVAERTILSKRVAERTIFSKRVLVVLARREHGCLIQIVFDNDPMAFLC